MPTVALKVVVSRTVSHGNEPAPFGEISANVTCTPRIEDRFVYVPILRDGTVTPGRMMVAATDMVTSAGRHLYASRTMLPIGH